MKHCLSALSVGLISLGLIQIPYAATPIKLDHKPISILQSLTSVKLINEEIDFNQTKHIHVYQTVKGYKVWGSDAVVHIPNGAHATLTHLGQGTTMNGTFYQNLQNDLINSPNFLFQPEQLNKALVHATQLYYTKSGFKITDFSKAEKSIIVYVDKNSKAHWAYLLKFYAGEKNNMPSVPTYILDAMNFDVYEYWNDLQTLDNVEAGGFGGNLKTGKIIYDGLKGDFPQLPIERDATKNLCQLNNGSVMVLDDNHKSGIFDADYVQFACDKVDPTHNSEYWDGEQDAVNGGFSPANDAMYIGQIIKSMYHDWYHVPPLSVLGFALPLKMNIHAKDFTGRAMDNAFFLPLTKEMYFGDGVQMFYPLTSLGVGSHEISHGFTSQHSNLTYDKQSGGLNESFSDMAAQAAEFYATGHNSWQIGPEIVKADKALRYMDDPTKDGRSIGHVKDYNDSLNVHFSSGVFNKVFYLLGTSSGWDTHKAFDVMVQANMYYWTANSTFDDAACGVVKATKDYKYDVDTVAKALAQVGISVSKC